MYVYYGSTIIIFCDIFNHYIRVEILVSSLHMLQELIMVNKAKGRV